MRTTLKLIMLCFLPLVACSQPGQGVVRKTNHTLSNQLQTDGLYSSYDTTLLNCGIRSNEHYKTFYPLIVINNSNAIFLHGGSLDFTFLSLDYYSKWRWFCENVGTYNVKNKKITAILPIGLYLRGMRRKLFPAYFEGEIKNRDTIINWRMVEPYPKAPRKFNDDFKDLLKPRLLYFMKSDELSGLDALYQQRLAEEQERKK